jgi:3-dehydroquinate dehydratase type I
VAWNRPRICASITGTDTAAIEKAEPLADLFEVRIDLIGAEWREVAGRLRKPWLACNRRAEEGGKWQGGETKRIEELLNAVDLGASIIDIELAASDLKNIIGRVKGKAECLVSYHDLAGTPSLEKMRAIVKRELAAGADVCKIVTTARGLKDNVTVLLLIRSFPEVKIVSFAMGEAGRLSRVLAPLAGGYFTFASLAPGRESADGQLTVRDLKTIYGVIENGWSNRKNEGLRFAG